ncbi:MAG TPA: AbrB family transcriptional regulator [Nitrososphaeraceae archaeon]
MGEKTSLTLNTPDKASLRTTVPMFIVKQWGLQVGQELDWSLEVCKNNNELVAVVRKAKAKPKAEAEPEPKQRKSKK